MDETATGGKLCQEVNLAEIYVTDKSVMYVCNAGTGNTPEGSCSMPSHRRSWVRHKVTYGRFIPLPALLCPKVGARFLIVAYNLLYGAGLYRLMVRLISIHLTALVEGWIQENCLVCLTQWFSTFFVPFHPLSNLQELLTPSPFWTCKYQCTCSNITIWKMFTAELQKLIQINNLQIRINFQIN